LSDVPHKGLKAKEPLKVGKTSELRASPVKMTAHVAEYHTDTQTDRYIRTYIHTERQSDIHRETERQIKSRMCTNHLNVIVCDKLE